MKRLALLVWLACLSVFGSDFVSATRYDLGIVDPCGSATWSQYTNSLQWVRNTGGTLLDYSPGKSNLISVVASPCVTWNGTAYLAVAGLTTNITVVSWQGTSTPSIAAGRINFTSGKCWNLLLSDGTFFTMQEGWGVYLFDVVNGRIGVITSGTLSLLYANTQDLSAYFATNGGSKSALFITGAGSSVTNFGSFISTNSDFSVDCWVRPSSLAGGAGRAILTAGSQMSVYQSGSNIVFKVGGKTLTSSTQLQLDAIVHVLCMYTTSGSALEIYINGSAASGSTSGTVGALSSAEMMAAAGGSLSGFAGDLFRVRYFQHIISIYEKPLMFSEGIDYTSQSAPYVDLKFYRAYGSVCPNYGTSSDNADMAIPTPVYYPVLASGTNDVVGAGILNPKGFVHNGGAEKVKQLGSGVSIFNGTSSKINTGLRNFGATTNGLNEWHIIFKPTWTSGIDYVFNNYNCTFSMYSAGANTLFEIGSSYEGVGVVSNDWNYVKLTFNSSNGYMEAKNMITGETDSGTRVGMIGLDVNSAANVLHLGSNNGGNGGFFGGSLAYFAFYADGVKKIEHILGNVSGTNAPNTGTSVTNGQATSVTVSYDATSIYSGARQIGSNSFWSASGITYDSKSLLDLITTTNATIRVTTNANGSITDLITLKGTP
jgi:hypothetical protein